MIENFDEKVTYELLFRSGKMESITKYRFNILENAKRKCKELNQGLRYKGYTDRKYVIAKITKEYIKE